MKLLKPASLNKRSYARLVSPNRLQTNGLAGCRTKPSMLLRHPNQRFASSQKSVSKPVAIVTGGNKGIGFEIAKQLSHKGHPVVLTSRSSSRATEAVKKLQSSNSGSKIPIFGRELELTSPSSVKEFSSWFSDQHGEAGLVFHNAAVMSDKIDEATVDTVLKTNYVGPTELTRQLKLSTDSRILFAGASFFLPSQKWKDPALSLIRNVQTPEDLRGLVALFLKSVRENSVSEQGFHAHAYAVSKAFVMAHSRILNEEMASQRVAVAAYCPGFCKTDLTGGKGMKTAAQGAEIPLWMALEAQTSEMAGKLIKDKKATFQL